MSELEQLRQRVAVLEAGRDMLRTRLRVVDGGAPPVVESPW